MQDRKFYKRYCGRYLLANFVAFIALVFISVVLQWEPPSNLSVVLAMVLAYYPAALFVKDHQRIPTKQETRHFAVGSLLLSSIFSLLLIRLSIMASPSEAEKYNEMSQNLSLIGIFSLIAFTLLVCYFLIAWGFKFGAKSEIKRMEKAAQKIKS